MKVRVIQGRPKIGDIAFNLDKIIKEIEVSKECDFIIFPELFLTGYPLEDRIFFEEIKLSVAKAIKQILKRSLKFKNLCILIGTPIFKKDKIYNSVLAICGGKILTEVYKSCLPNYGVFDEARYFSKGEPAKILKFKGKKILISVCEEIWNDEYIKNAKNLKPDLVFIINASPFEKGKFEKRLARVKQFKCNSIYVNQVLGYDELIFDGRSFAVSSKGSLVFELSAFKEVSHTFETEDFTLKSTKFKAKQNDLKLLYNALIFGLSEYITQNGFKGVLLGLSGGIDSALCAKIAIDAVGKENVLPVFLPSKISGQESKKDALEFLKLNGLIHKEISIIEIFKTLQKELGLKSGLSVQNLQSRIRGTILMALSNETGKMLITTGNKSELATGYCTIYGDMNGGFNPIKDIYKTEVFELCNFLNSGSPIFPKNMLTKAPTAELEIGQTDEASFGMPYKALDFILKLIIEENRSFQAIPSGIINEINKFRKSNKMPEIKNMEAFEKVKNMLSKAQFKRAQSATGTKVSSRAFGRDWRFGLKY